MASDAPSGSRLSTGRGVRSRAAALLLSAVMAAVAILSAAAALGGEWGPWAAREEFPVIGTPGEKVGPAETPPEPGIGSPGALPLVALVRLYQSRFSPVYGSRCPMTPSCSQYALDAIRKHGPLVGAVLTAGRLMHEADERRVAPIRRSGDRYLFFDPVENNDFWFRAR